jgi:hypothetical protein
VRDEIRVRLDAALLTGPDAMLTTADSSLAADARPAANTSVTLADQVGLFLTDEVFLYRVCDLVVTGAGEMVDLEDCYALDVVRVPMNDLRARELRVVNPAHAEPSSGAGE